MKYKIARDQDLFKIMFYNKAYDLWLTYNTDRFTTEKEAEKAIKKLK